MLQRLVFPFLLLVSTCACAADAGHGHVKLHGSIIDRPCAIAVGDRDQTINLGTVPISELLHKKQQAVVPFHIHLINCTFKNADVHNAHRHSWENFHVTFIGEKTNDSLFALTGSASGEAIAIDDSEGHQAIPGEPLPDQKLIPGSMTLNYKLYLSADQSHLKPGKIQAYISYLMDYD